MGKKTINELLSRQNEINDQIGAFEGRELNAEEQKSYEGLLREFEANKRAITTINQAREAAKNTPAKSANARLRELVTKVRTREVDGQFLMQREATDAITSGVIQSGGVSNIESAGLPITIKELINPLDSPLIYNQLGIKIATGVRGQLQWPVLDSVVEATVGGELDAVPSSVIDFAKIVSTPVKIGLSVKVSNEAINDAAFDLAGVITEQMSKGIARTLNKRVLALTAPSTKSEFAGPLVAHKQTATFAGEVPTYKELKALKGLVLKTGAQMAGACFIMDAAMYANLEATPKDAGSGRFVIENGMIDGDRIFITDLAEYAGKVVYGCFGYEALNQHGDTYFVIDPYTEAKRNVTVFTLNTDFSLTYLVRAKDKAPFAVGAKAGA